MVAELFRVGCGCGDLERWTSRDAEHVVIEAHNRVGGRLGAADAWTSPSGIINVSSARNTAWETPDSEKE